MKAKFETFRNKNGEERLGIEKNGEYFILDYNDAEELYFFLVREVLPDFDEGEE